jgi:hypothetical protein
MLAYMQAMWNANVGIDSVLDLGPSALLVDKYTKNVDNSNMYVRDCYQPLADLIWSALHQNLNVVLSGTPGIGKTEFRNFFVWCCLQKVKNGHLTDVTLVLHGMPGDRAMTCAMLKATTGGTFEALRVPAADLLKYVNGDDPNLFYLADVSKGDTQALKDTLPAGKIVVFTSPNEKTYSEFGKSKLFSGHPLYMPLWRKPELAAALQLRDIDPQSDFFQRRWTLYNGVPRAFLEHSYAARVKEALSGMDWTKATESVEAVNNTKQVKHRLLYYVVNKNLDGSYNFKEAQLRWGSYYLLGQAADTYIQLLVSASTNLHFNPWNKIGRGVQGDFLEAVAHRSICISKKLLLRRLGHTSKELFKGESPYEFEFGGEEKEALEWTWCKSVQETVQTIKLALQQKKNVYICFSDDQFPAVDAVLVLGAFDIQHVLLLQMTINVQHGITGPAATKVYKELVQACKADNKNTIVSQVWVVGAGQFRVYPKQKIPSAPVVKQYVANLGQSGSKKRNRVAGDESEEI